jgi:pimeloyl-ACP methyl ester carboxylesterase
MRLLLTQSVVGILTLGPAAHAVQDKVYLPLKAEAYAVPAAGVSESGFVTIGGIEQWVTVRGHDKTNPVILILGSPGGGPGSTTSHVVQAFMPWEKDFTVVHWDARGSGKTFVKAGQTVGPDLTMDRLVQDGLELTDYLRQRLGTKKIVILAAGYGSVLGLKMIAARPDRFSAFVSAGLVVNPAAEREQYFHQRLVELATAANDQAALKDLAFSGWKVWDEGDDPKKRQALIGVYRRYRPPNPNYLGLAPGWTPDDLKAMRLGMLKGDEVLLPEFKTYDFSKLGVRFQVPIVVLQGEEDRFQPTPYAKAWLDKISTPKKAFGVIRGGGNHFMETHPEEFLALLLQHVRPLAVAP